MLIIEPDKRFDAKNCSDEIKRLTTKKFHLLEVLNHSLFSNVYLATEWATEKKKQIKLINSKNIKNKDHLKLTLKETKAISRVKTKMLVDTWDDFFIENKHLYLVMDSEIKVKMCSN